jgi:hypothetical protein
MSTRASVQTQGPGSAGSGREVDRPPGVGDLSRELRELLPDEVVDELLAGARSEEEIVGGADCFRS